MTKNLYFRTNISRTHALSKTILNGFLNLSSFPRLCLEVFIRRNFGERYFTFTATVTVAIILACCPNLFNFLMNKWAAVTSVQTYNEYGEIVGRNIGGAKANFWARWGTWYLFIAAILYFGWQRRQEMKKNPSVFDFAQFSYYAGDRHPMVEALRMKEDDKKDYFKIASFELSVRQMDIVFEPLLFLVPGVLLAVFSQPLGWLLIGCSLVYGLSYAGAYKNGDDFVMDRIDEMIMNEEMKSAFVDNKPSSQTRGVTFYSRKPNGADDRQKLADSFVVDDAADAR